MFSNSLNIGYKNNLAVNFTGCYSCKINSFSKESKDLANKGVEVINDAGKYLESLRNINCGKYTLTNVEVPSKISPVLKATVDDKELSLTKYLDGFNLNVTDGMRADNLSFWGGDIVEFESSHYPLKPSQYKMLEGDVLKRADEILKNFLPIFSNK